MRIEDLSEKLDEAFRSEKKQARHRLARDLGWEFPKRNLDVISEFRSQVFCRLQNAVDPEVRGFFEAMLDIAAAYSAAIKQVLEREEIEKLARERGWTDILLSLLELPKRIEQLAPATKREMEALQKEIFHMRCVYLVDASFADSPLYCLTASGHDLAEKLKSKP